MSQRTNYSKERETLEHSVVSLAGARRLICSASSDEVAPQLAYSFLEASQVTESFGVNCGPEYSVTGHCAAREHASSQYPVTRRTLPQAQSKLRESLITHTCHPWLKVSSSVVENNIWQSCDNTYAKQLILFTKKKKSYNHYITQFPT